MEPNSEAVTTAILDAAEAATLSGDIRDALLTHVRSIKVPWTMLAEDEQRDVIAAISRTAEHAVRIAAATVAQRGFPHLVVEVGKWTVKDGIKMEAAASASLANINALAEHGARSAVLVLADASDFVGERAEAKPDKDQPDLYGEAA